MILLQTVIIRLLIINGYTRSDTVLKSIPIYHILQNQGLTRSATMSLLLMLLKRNKTI